MDESLEAADHVGAGTRTWMGRDDQQAFVYTWRSEQPSTLTRSMTGTLPNFEKCYTPGITGTKKGQTLDASTQCA